MDDGRLFIGLMSGTSLDGVDAALVRVDGHGPAMRATFLHLSSVAYTDADRQLATVARRNELDLGGLADGGARIARRYAEAVRQLLADTATRPEQVAALAAHGQTIYHAPPLTWQLFDPTVLAYETGIEVVSDFRRADCAAGGQGAPLVPFGDWVLFRHATIARVILNIGGIANLTVLPAGSELADVVGYDIGPGNCLSDWLMRDEGGYDAGGEIARAGRPIEAVVDAVRADAFFRQAGPKSTDVPQMLGLFREAIDRLAPDASLADRLATGNEIAARLIVDEVCRAAGDPGRAELYIAGGGVHNRHLMDRLTDHGLAVRHTDKLGIPTQAREAVAFALLAAAHLDRLPCYMPKVTGAGRPSILGSLTPGSAPFSHAYTGAATTPASPPASGRPAPGRSV